VKADGVETQLTRGKSVTYPRWSYDGQWLAYLVINDPARPQYSALHARNLRTNQDTIVAFFQKNSRNEIAWSPNRDILAFQYDTNLNVIDTHNIREQGFRNVALGVNEFSWLPDGNGFLVSSAAHLRPDGWTNARMYTVSLASDTSRINTVVPFYTLPNEVGAAGKKVLAIGTSTFKWSPDRKWIAFIVDPTASWSADSNILCVLSSDAKRFIPVAEMLNRNDWFEWAPQSSKLAFIEGGSRFITQNKRIGIASAPQFKAIDSFTPKGLVDNAFTWNDNMSLTVSRAQEGDYKAKLSPEQLPSLYNVQLHDHVARRITNPPVGFGDYQPMWQQKSHSIIWVRSNDKDSSVWIGDRDGSNQRRWITNISREEWTPYWSMWNKLLDIM
jgi:Tol biopolymer transport system component